MAVKFPDIEKTIVAYFVSVLPNDVRVATKKAAPDKVGANKQVIITASFNQTSEYVLKTASVTIDVFANTYATCSDLAFLVDAHVPGMVGVDIKKAEVALGPIRMAETNGEHRSLDVQVIVKGSPL